MRRVLAAILLLTACSGEESGQSPGAPTAGAADERIECAIGGTTFERACELQQEGDRITIRHPDGGFRRLLITGDGRGVIAADGAERAQVAVIGPGRIEVTLGSDRYRLPATIRSDP